MARRLPIAVRDCYSPLVCDDGLWRRHSWGILRDGVLETTEARLKYFGIVLQGIAGDKAAEFLAGPS